MTTRRALALLAGPVAAALLLLGAVPAAAQTNVTLVSNLGQGSVAEWALNNEFAQAFTTGSASAGNNFKLTRVDLKLRGTTQPGYNVSIRWNGSDNLPGGSLGTLTNPASLPASIGTVQFAAPGSGIELSANTTYWIVLDVTSTHGGVNAAIRTTNSDAEDQGAASGWSIANGLRHRTWNATSWGSPDTGALQMAIVGYEKADTTAPTISSVAIGSTPPADTDDDGTADTYGIGDTIHVDVTFNESVKINAGQGANVRLRLDVGSDDLVYGNSRRVLRSPTVTGPVLRFQYTVTETADSDPDGVWVQTLSRVDQRVVLLSNQATLKDAAGNDVVLTKSGMPTSGDAGHKIDAVRPRLTTTRVVGDALTLNYLLETLDADSVPAADDFTVKVAGSEVDLADTDPVAVSGSTVTLTLASADIAGKTVTVSYAKGTNPIQDAAGNDAAAFTDVVVTNRTVRPSTPTQLAVSAGSDHTRLDVSWRAPSSLGSAASIADYDLRYY